jgi:hypothetical protein
MQSSQKYTVKYTYHPQTISLDAAFSNEQEEIASSHSRPDGWTAPLPTPSLSRASTVRSQDIASRRASTVGSSSPLRPQDSVSQRTSYVHPSEGPPPVPMLPHSSYLAPIPAQNYATRRSPLRLNTTNLIRNQGEDPSPLSPTRTFTESNIPLQRNGGWDLRRQSFSRIPLEMIGVTVLPPKGALPVWAQKLESNWAKFGLLKRAVSSSTPRQGATIEPDSPVLSEPNSDPISDLSGVQGSVLLDMKGPRSRWDTSQLTNDLRNLPTGAKVMFSRANLSQQAELEILLLNQPIVSPHYQAKLSIYEDREDDQHNIQPGYRSPTLNVRSAYTTALMEGDFKGEQQTAAHKSNMRAQRNRFESLRKEFAAAGNLVTRTSPQNHDFSVVFRNYNDIKQRMLHLQALYIEESRKIIQNYIELNANLKAFNNGFELAFYEAWLEASRRPKARGNPSSNSSSFFDKKPPDDFSSAKKNRYHLMDLMPLQESTALIEALSHCLTLTVQGNIDHRLVCVPSMDQKDDDIDKNDEQIHAEQQQKLIRADSAGRKLAKDIAAHFTSPAALQRLKNFQIENNLRPTHTNTIDPQDRHMDNGNQLAYLLWDYSQHHQWGQALKFYPHYFVYLPPESSAVRITTLEMDLNKIKAENKELTKQTNYLKDTLHQSLDMNKKLMEESESLAKRQTNFDKKLDDMQAQFNKKWGPSTSNA